MQGDPSNQGSTYKPNFVPVPYYVPVYIPTNPANLPEGLPGNLAGGVGMPRLVDPFQGGMFRSQGEDVFDLTYKKYVGDFPTRGTGTYTPDLKQNNPRKDITLYDPAPFNYSKEYMYKAQKNPTKVDEVFAKQTHEDKYHPNYRNPLFGYDKEGKNYKVQPIKPDPFLFKPSQQIVNEFKANTLPKLRLKRLVKLQAMMRGFLVRRFKIPKKRIMNKIIDEYVDKLISNFIEAKFVPDIVLEIITYNKYNEDVSLYSTEHRIFLEVMDRVCNNVVREMCRNIAQEATDALVTDILKKRGQGRPPPDNDPLSLVCTSLMGRAIRADCTEIVQESMKELVDEYIMETHFTRMIKSKYLFKMLLMALKEALDEIIIEDYVDMIIDGLIKEVATPTAVHILEGVQAEYEGVELQKAAQNYRDRCVIEILIEQLIYLLDERNKGEGKFEIDEINYARKKAQDVLGTREVRKKDDS